MIKERGDGIQMQNKHHFLKVFFLNNPWNLLSDFICVFCTEFYDGVHPEMKVVMQSY